MSTEIGKIRGRLSATKTLQGIGLKESIYVTRFSGGIDGKCIQLTIGDKYVQLDQHGKRELIAMLEEA